MKRFLTSGALALFTFGSSIAPVMAEIRIRDSNVRFRTSCPTVSGVLIESSSVYFPSNLDSRLADIDINRSRIYVLEENAPCLRGQRSMIYNGDVYIERSNVQLIQYFSGRGASIFDRY